MNVEAKKNELIRWILTLGEDALSHLDAFKRDTQQGGFILDSKNDKVITEREYKAHIEKIRSEVLEGKTTYSTKEVKDFVLHSHKK